MRSVSPPRMFLSSSWTILMTCCAGLSAFDRSAPMACSRMRATRSFTVEKATSASSSASRISRRTSSTSSSLRRPRPRRRVKIPSKRSLRLSNMRRAGVSPLPAGPDGGGGGTISGMRPPHPTDYAAWVERLTIPHHNREAFWHLVLSGPAALDAVRAGLAHDEAAVRVGCTRVLDHLVDEASWNDLLAMLDDEDDEVRWSAMHALACDRCKENGCAPSKAKVLPHAMRSLREDPAPLVRAIAIEVVGRWVHSDVEIVAA